MKFTIKKKPRPPPTPKVEDFDETPGDPTYNMEFQMGLRERMKRDAVLAADPTAFMYDAVYDEISSVPRDRREQERRRFEQKTGLKVGLTSVGRFTIEEQPNEDDNREKSRYIQKMVSNAKRRELEAEIVNARQLQKATEAAGVEPEAFVTSGYQAKLEQRKELERQLEREEAEARANSATNRQDLVAIHQSLLESGKASRRRGPAEPAEGSAKRTRS